MPSENQNLKFPGRNKSENCAETHKQTKKWLKLKLTAALTSRSEINSLNYDARVCL